MLLPFSLRCATRLGFGLLTFHKPESNASFIYHSFRLDRSVEEKRLRSRVCDFGPCIPIPKRLVWPYCNHSGSRNMVRHVLHSCLRMFCV